MMSKSDLAYPAGRKEWKIVRDPCALGDDTVRNLTLTTCTKEKYTCNNGMCIDINQVHNN